MDPSIVALAVAAFGVLGTMAAPIVSALTAGRIKNRELQLQEDIEHRRRAVDAQRTGLVELRDCYIRLNTSARVYQNLMLSHTFEIERANTDTLPTSNTNLVDARMTYRRCYAESQMVVSDAVLEASRIVNGLLADVYGMLRRVEEGQPGLSEDLSVIRRLIEDIGTPLYEMRKKMRDDLGVSSQE